MHEKALTADILEGKGWDNNVVCPLCLQEAETNYHLLIDCQFAKEVTKLINEWQQGPNLDAMPNAMQVAQWFQNATELMAKGEKKEHTGKILYVWWNERN